MRDSLFEHTEHCSKENDPQNIYTTIPQQVDGGIPQQSVTIFALMSICEKKIPCLFSSQEVRISCEQPAESDVFFSV